MFVASNQYTISTFLIYTDFGFTRCLLKEGSLELLVILSATA